MVRKLWKHEYLAWLRILPLIYGITLVVAAMLRLILVFENDSIYYTIIAISAFVMFFISIMVTLAASVVFGIQRFYKNMFTGEGYLTHTLPVTPAAHLWVKLLTAGSFSFLSFLVCLLAGMIATAGEVFTEIGKAVDYLIAQIPLDIIPHVSGWIAEYTLFMVAAILNSHLLFYLCICLGQLAKKNRALAAVGVYFAIYMISQILGTVIAIAISILAETTDLLKNLSTLMENHLCETIHVFLCGGTVLATVIGLVCYLICHRIVSKKLNLE